jgi:putative peptidoglycan lipid II flippase
MLVKILAPAFFSRQDTKTPVRVAIHAMVANMVMNVVFVVPLVLLKVPGAHAGLALATALASYLNAGLLFRHLRKTGVYQPAAGWRTLIMQMVFAVVVMSTVVAWGIPEASAWPDMSGSRRTLEISIWIGAGVAAYLAALRLSGVRLSVLWSPAVKSAGKP